MPFFELVSRRRRTRVSFVALTIGTLFPLVTCKLNDLISPTTTTTAAPTVSLSADSTVVLGGTTKLIATVSAPGTGQVSSTSYGVAWSVDKPTVAQVATDGTITGVAIGTATVTAKILAPELGDNGPTVSKTISVAYGGIKIVAVDSLRAIGATRAMVVNGLDAKGNPGGTIAAAQVSFLVRDTTVLKVDATGTLTARKSATTYVLATMGAFKDSVAVKVRQIAKTVNFGGATMLLVGSVGKARTITVNALDSTSNVIPAGVATVAWSVNNTATATIGAATGSLTALKVDTTTITVVVDGISAKILMSVVQVPATITKTAGDARSDAVATAVSVLPKVTVVDSGGNAIAKDTVVFVVATGNGSISSGATQVTDASGVATVGNWVLGPAATAQTLLATSGPASATFTVTGLPLAAKKLIFVTQPQTAATSTALASFTVAVADSLGNVVTTATPTSITLTVSPPSGSSGTLGGTVTGTTSNGIFSFTTVTVSQSGTGYALIANGGGYSGTSNPFTVYGAKAKLLVPATQGSLTGRKAQVLPSLQIAIADASGNVVGNSTDSVAVAIATTTGASGAHLTGTTKVAAVAGIATFSNLVIDSVGQSSTGNPYKLTATSGTLTSTTTSSFDVQPVGSAAKLAFTVQPVSTTAGTTLISFAVMVQDSGGATVTTATNSVTLGIQAGSGSLSGTTTVSATNGVATFTNVSIGKAGTGYSLNAVASGLTTAASNTFNITTAATGTKLVFIQQPYNAAISTSISPAVTVALEDAFGNVITTDTNSVTLAITSGTGTSGATLSGGAASHPQSGVATFSALSIGTIGSNYTVTATASGRASAISPTFSIVAASGTAMKLGFTTQPNNAIAGSVISPSIVVATQDAQGSTLAGNLSSIVLSVASGSSSALVSNGTVGPSGGVATFANAFITTAGTYTLLASQSGSGYNPATSTSFVISPASRSKMAFLAQPSTSVAGTVVPPVSTAVCSAVCVAVEDQYGNVVTSDNSDQISLSINGAGSLGGTITAQVQNGIATFSNLRVRTAGTTVGLIAAASGLSSAQSSTFAVSAAPETGVAFKTQPSSIVATTTYATGSQIQVQLADSLGNVITTATDSVKLSIATGPTGGAINGTTTVAAVNGIATFANVSFTTQGSYVLTASSGTLATANSVSFSVTAGSANKLVITAQPTGTVAAGTNMGFTVTVEDANNNVITGAAPTIFLSLGSNPGSTALSGSGNTSVNPVSGVATFSNLQLTKVGTGYTVLATASGLTSATSAAFNITAAAASQLVFTTQPQQVGYGIGQTVVVALEDTYGNVVTSNSTNSISLTTSPSVTPVNGGAAVTLSSGVATFNGFAIAAANTYTLTATVSSLGFTRQSNSFVVSAPGTVVSSGTPYSLVIVGSSIYWTDKTAGTLNTASIYGGSSQNLLTGLNNPGGIASDGSGNLYWMEESQLAGTIKRYNIAGKTAATVVTGFTQGCVATPGCYHVDNDGTNLYFVASNGSAYGVYRVLASATGLGLSGATSLSSAGGIPTFTYTTVSGAPAIFFSDGLSNANISKITSPAGTPSVTHLAGPFSGSVASYVNGFAVVGSSLYFTDGTGGVTTLSTSGSTPTAVSGITNVSTITTDGTSLYLTQTTSGVTSLVRYNTNTSTLTTLGGNPSGAGITINGSDVYWADSNGILKTAK